MAIDYRSVVEEVVVTGIDAGRVRREREFGPRPHQPCSPAPRGQRPHPAQVSESARRARHRPTLVDRATWLDALRWTNSGNHEAIGRARYELLDFVSSGRPSNTRTPKLPFRLSPPRSRATNDRRSTTALAPARDDPSAVARLWLEGPGLQGAIGEHVLSCAVAHRRHKASR